MSSKIFCKSWGAEYIAADVVRFRLWATGQQKVMLRLAGKDQEMQANGDGWFTLDVAGVTPGTEYNFVLSDGMVVPDPASRAQKTDVNGPSYVVDPGSYTWRNTGWKGSRWEQAVVYEMHTGTFTPEGTFRAAIAKLPYLAELGVTVIEVILDVVYNHTAEGNELGPTLSFKGIDNFSYYRTMPDQHRYYINDTGTGNTVNTSHPRVLQMVMDSLRYWAESMHVDGFRFDLGTILGREPEGFDQRGGFFDAVTQDPVLAKLKLIGEPWDIGPGGYQVGGFPPGWGEWNDKYRDTVREYWKGDNVTNDFAARLLGSGDLYDLRGRRPWSSVNFITAHDGFTLNDLVSYNDKHNEANGEDNNDGHNDNRSCNYGAEGPTDDEGINAIRERQKRNFLTTLLFSHGTPMLLAGDEFGRSQMGNNNGYCQDSEISWVHWDNLPETANALREFTRHLIQLRATQPLLRRESWRDGLEIRWFNAGGGAQQSEQWDEGSTIGVCISRPDLQPEAGIWHDALLLFNPFEGSVPFRIPMWGEGGWVLELTTADNAQQGMRITEEMDFDLAGRSIVLFRRP